MSEATNDKTLHFSEDEMEKFLWRNSFSGLMALYFFYLSFKSQKAFTFENVEKKYKLTNKYTHAYLVVVFAIGFINFTINDDVYNITSYDEVFALKVKKVVHEMAIEEAKKNINSLWKNRIKEMENSLE